MEKELLVICPTRGRVELCIRMIKSFENKSSKLAELIFIIDWDDPMFEDYVCIFKYTGKRYVVRSGHSLTEMYNMIVNRWYKDFKYYSETNDDFIYHTGNWDRILINKLEEKGGGIAYGDDGFCGKDLPTTSVISGEIIQAVGWIHMPTLGYLCNDVVWREIGHRLNRLFYIPEVKIEHIHYIAGKAEKDDTYLRTNSDESYTNDHLAFRAWKSLQMDNDIEKIRGVLCNQK